MFDLATFRNAMAAFPAGVVIAIAADRAGELKGFTASAFCSVSLDPPMVLVCQARSAESWDAFQSAEHFSISVLRPDQQDTALLFAKRGADKFAEPATFAPAAHGLRTVAGAQSTLICRTAGRHEAGDHTIMVGEVVEVGSVDGGDTMLHFRRGFRRLGAEPAA